MRLANPYYLLFLLIIPLLILMNIKKRQLSVGFTQIDILKKVKPRAINYRLIFSILTSFVIFFIVISLSRPQKGITSKEVSTKALNIMILLDISGSMQAIDFKPEDRLTVAKKVVKDFILKRKNDQLGLVIFARKAFLQCPLTLDHGILIDLIDKVKYGLIDDGTAIGTAIALGVQHIKDIKAKSKIMILVTDGANNSGKIDPYTAAKLAKKFNIKLYTIGVGKRGEALVPVKHPILGTILQPIQDDLNEDLLMDMADMTGGYYSRATHPKTLKEIFDNINKQEKTEIKSLKFTSYREYFQGFIALAFIFACVEFIIRNLIFKGFL